MKDKAYEEIGPNYRFFLAWRHATFAGGLVILWGACTLLTAAYEKGLSIAWLIPLLASLAAFCLWLADRRTRQIYRSLTVAGMVLEGENHGPYSALTKIGIPENAPWFPKKDQPLCKFYSQSFALDCFFLGSALILLAAVFFVFFSPPSAANRTQSLPTQQAANANALAIAPKSSTKDVKPQGRGHSPSTAQLPH
jgi:hypothetical protein